MWLPKQSDIDLPSSMAGNHRELLEYIEGATYGSTHVNEEQFSARLNEARPAFLNLLRYKVMGMAISSIYWIVCSRASHPVTR